MSRQHLGIQHIRRLEEIGRVLISFGFREWLKRLRFGRVLARLKFQPGGRNLRSAESDSQAAGTAGPLRGRAGRDPASESLFAQARAAEADSWRRLRLALESLGPTFIKVGQILSNRADILPAGLILELSKLQDQVPAFTAAEARQVIESDLSTTVSEIFQDFSDTPVASASIAQVHEAWLKDGQRVAVKVQRPGIEPLIIRDLEILAFLGRLVWRYLPEYRQFDPPAMVAEFSRQILRELDFTLELHHMQRFAHNFRGSRDIHVPTAWPRHCSRRVLTMEYVQGRKLSTLLDPGSSYRASTATRRALARRLASLLLEQVFVHGFFHADPHPGNIILLGQNLPCFLDFGMMGHIQKNEQRTLLALLEALVRQDPHQVTGRIMELVGHQALDIPELEYEIADLLDLYFDRPLKDLDVGEVFQRMVLLVQAHHIPIPSKFLLLAKALMIAEGIGSQLSPEFSFLELFQPFAAKMALKHLAPQTLAKEFLGRAGSLAEMVKEVPMDSMQVLQMLKQGRLGINFRLVGTEPIIKTLETVGTRLVFGLVLAAILVSSSLIVNSGIPPLVSGIPVIGIIGYGIAGLMSFGFLLSIISRLWHRPGKGDK